MFQRFCIATHTYTHNQIYLWERYRESSFNANEDEKLIKKLDIYYLLDLYKRKIRIREEKFEIDWIWLNRKCYVWYALELTIRDIVLYEEVKKANVGLRGGGRNREIFLGVRFLYVMKYQLLLSINTFLITHKWHTRGYQKIFALTKHYQIGHQLRNHSITRSLTHLLTHCLNVSKDFFMQIKESIHIIYLLIKTPEFPAEFYIFNLFFPISFK